MKTFVEWMLLFYVLTAITYTPQEGDELRVFVGTIGFLSSVVMWYIYYRDPLK